MKHISILIVLLVLLAACETVPKTPIDAAEAITLAKAQPNGVMVKVVFKVCRVEQGMGVDVGKIYLDSEFDYRDPKSLNIVLVDDAADAAKKLAKGDVGGAYLNHKIEVSGYATRIQLGRVVNGRSVAPFYYQTQLEISNPSRLRIID